VGQQMLSRSKFASLKGRLLLNALSHWRRAVAILGAAAITPMIHSRYYTEWLVPLRPI